MTDERPRGPSRRRQIIRGIVLFVVAFLVLVAADASRQPTSGSGWRIIGYQRATGVRGTVARLADQAALDNAWQTLGFDGSPGPFDFDRADVFWFVSTGTIGCPSHFGGVQIDLARRVVSAIFTLAFTSGCDDHAVPDAFIVAIDRSRLPSAPFVVELSDPPPPNSPNAIVTVTR